MHPCLWLREGQPKQRDGRGSARRPTHHGRRPPAHPDQRGRTPDFVREQQSGPALLLLVRSSSDEVAGGDTRSSRKAGTDHPSTGCRLPVVFARSSSSTSPAEHAMATAQRWMVPRCWPSLRRRSTHPRGRARTAGEGSPVVRLFHDEVLPARVGVMGLLSSTVRSASRNASGCSMAGSSRASSITCSGQP